MERPETPILSYARRSGLCKDYTSVKPLREECLPSPPPDCRIDLDDSDLLPVRIPSAGVPEERLTIDHSAARYLQSLFSYAGHDIHTSYPVRRYYFRNLKLEPPLLATDPQLDLVRFLANRKQSPDLNKLELKPFEGDADDEQQLEWPLTDDTLLELKDKATKFEILHCPRAAMEYLMSIVKPTFDTPDPSAVLIPPRDQKLNDLHMSPPLTPISYSAYDNEAEMEAYEMEFTSTPPDPTAADLSRVDDAIMKGDGPLSPEANQDATSHFLAELLEDDDGYLPSRRLSFGTSEEQTVAKRPRAEDLKIEGPLTPIDDYSSPLKKTKRVTFMQDVARSMPEYAHSDLSKTMLSDEDEYNRGFDDMIRLAEPAIYQTMHEQLQDADAMLRMPVPVLHNIDPVAPWTIRCNEQRTGDPERSTLDSQRQLFAMFCHDHLSTERSWRCGGNERDLRWVPVPESAGEAVTEEAFDELQTTSYMQSMTFEESLDPATLIWKREGLRLLDDTEDDNDELEPQYIETGELDISTLIRRRQTEIQAGDGTRHKSGKATTSTPSNGAGVSLASASSIDHKPGLIPGSLADAHSSTSSGLFCAGLALDRFMKVQNARVQEPLATSNSTVNITHLSEPRGQDLGLEVIETSQKPQSKLADIPLPLPLVRPVTFTQSFLVSATLLQQRDLMRKIESICPGAQLLQRDFQKGDGASFRQREDRAVCAEADIVVSAGTGLVATTLQKIKQRSLPGQRAVSGIRERLSHLSLRYASLVVLVGEGAGGHDDCGAVRELDSNDCDHLNMLRGFTASLEADVHIVYVPGGETELATWIVSCMARFDGQDRNVELVQDETLWEVFLRQAGVNAFAAQAMLSKLKRSLNPNPASMTYHGLSALIIMSEQERLARFSSLMGGERVLGRVSKVLDTRWPSAALLLDDNDLMDCT